MHRQDRDAGPQVHDCVMVHGVVYEAARQPKSTNGLINVLTKHTLAGSGNGLVSTLSFIFLAAIVMEAAGAILLLAGRDGIGLDLLPLPRGRSAVSGFGSAARREEGHK